MKFLKAIQALVFFYSNYLLKLTSPFKSPTPSEHSTRYMHRSGVQPELWPFCATCLGANEMRSS